MKLAPTVIIHGLPHAQAALAAARPVTLLSAPGAGAYAGVGWWRALVAAVVGQAPPHTLADDILDCGAAPGRALEALRAGQRLLVLRAVPGVFADLSERAAAQGATLMPVPPPALDLAGRANMRLLAAWLAIAE